MDEGRAEFVNETWTVRDATGAGPASSPTPSGVRGGRSSGASLGYGVPPGGDASEVSRRSFLKGIIASGASISALTYFGSACGRPGREAEPAPGGVERLVTLRVNGERRRVDVLPQETLAMTLRYKLGLTGTKLGCDRAECGACTVTIDGVAHYACSTLTHRVRGREVTTVEGLEGPDGSLHPVQQAFIDELGPQCGFCTPGQVMAAAALLESNPAPTREEARRAMSGNICRCGAYDHYLNGVMRASERMRTSGGDGDAGDADAGEAVAAAPTPAGEV